MKKVYFFAILLLTIFSFGASAQNVKYVKPGGTGNGSSWANASGDLQAMIDASTGEDSIWVAKGIYKPTKPPVPQTSNLEPAGPRDVAFVLKKGANIFGGFAGTENSFEERDFVANETILSGDLNDDGVASDGDAYHVLVTLNQTGLVELNGFIIQHGFANGTLSIGTESVTSSITLTQNNGGAICTRGASLEYIFKNLIIRDNYATSHGGGVYTRNGGTKTYTWDNVAFLNNTSGGNGGGLYSYPSTVGSTTIVNDCTFDGNASNMSTSSTSNGGGGLYFNGSSTSTFRMRGGVVKNNTSKFGGAGVFVYQAGTVATDRVYVKKVKFENNVSSATANGWGGNLAVTRIAEIDSCDFKGGVGLWGGAIYGSSNSTLTITNCSFENNSSNSTAATTTGNGGGAIVAAGTQGLNYIYNCTFINNSSKNVGGAVHIAGNLISIIKSSFYGNTANFGGGAVSSNLSSGDIVNCVFYNNTANSANNATVAMSGGAIYGRVAAKFNLINNTFVKNTSKADGGAIYFANTTAGANTLYNSILYKNTTNEVPNEIRLGNAQTLIAKSNLTQIFGVDGVDDTMVGVNPDFVDEDDFTNAEFLRLKPTSKAINMGEVFYLPDTLTLDLAGNARITHDFVDLGAYEYFGSLSSLLAFHIKENSSVGTAVGTLTHPDLSGATTWEILSGNIDNTFAYNASSGEVTVANNALLDYETRRSFKLRVQGTSGGNVEAFSMFVLIDNEMEKPGTPIILNRDTERNEVRSYFPVLSGVAEPLSEVQIFMDGKDTGERTQTNSQGKWTYTLATNVGDGNHTFYIVTSENILGVSVPSEPVSALFLLYPGVIVPNNILTLNNDGINDVWEVKFLPLMYPQNEVIVFNKAGKVVFQKSNYSNDWDGTDKNTNQKLSAGTYYYHINVGAGLKPYKGTITVLSRR